MQKNQIVTFTIITILIGFMLAVQYQSTNTVHERDTRDLWDLREDYMEATELETTLLKEIRAYEKKIAEYYTERIHSPEKILTDTLMELRDEAGFTKKYGPGIVLTFSKATEFILPGQREVFISPELLRKLLNELNMYGAEAISIAEQRIVANTVIREIQGETKVDGYPLRVFPFEVKVIADNMETVNKLYNRLQISTIKDDFIIDRIHVEISEPMEEVQIPAYTNKIDVNIMAPVNEEGGK